LIVADEESRENEEWFDRSSRTRQRSDRIWMIAYCSLVVVFFLLVMLVNAILRSFLIAK
jgi:hypothetical protein